MKTPIHDPMLHFDATVGTVLPADYLNPPDGPHGPVLDATLFCPLLSNRSTEDADKLLVHRTAKGEQWVVVDEFFTNLRRKCLRDVSQADVRKMVGLS